MSYVYEVRIRTATIRYTHQIFNALLWIEEAANANHKTYYHVTLPGRRCETEKIRLSIWAENRATLRHIKSWYHHQLSLTILRPPSPVLFLEHLIYALAYCCILGIAVKLPGFC